MTGYDDFRKSVDFLCIIGAVKIWQIGRKVKDYNKRWADVPCSEKRDVVAALRAATKLQSMLHLQQNF